MPLVIDTYNVLHVTGVLPGELAVGEPEGLARLIEASRFAAEAVWLVCDGVPRGASRVGRIVIEGAGPRRKADDHIADIVGRSSAPRRVMVVTSDRELSRRVRGRGADVVRSEEFLAMLAEDARRARPRRKAPPDPRRSVPLDDREVAGWMAVFRITAEQAAIAGASPRGGTAGGAASAAGHSKAVGEPSAAGEPNAAGEPPVPAPAPVRRPSSDAALQRFLEATRDLDDPLSILDQRAGDGLLAALGAIDDDALDALMKQHEPPVLKDGARIGGRNRVRKGDARKGDARNGDAGKNHP